MSSFLIQSYFDSTVTPRNVALALSGLSLHWNDIGKSLKVPTKELQQIENAYTEPEKCLYQVILYWTMNTEVCTWSAVKCVIALIDKEHLQKFDTFMHNLNYIKKFAEVGENVKEILPQLDVCYDYDGIRTIQFENNVLRNKTPDIEDLKCIIKIIADRVPLKWKQIGIQLGIAKGKLDTIECDYHRVEDCILEMIYEWHYNDQNAWLYLIAALQNIESYGIAEVMTKLAKSCKSESTETPSLREIKSDKDRERNDREKLKDEHNKKQKATLQKISTLLRVNEDVSDEDIISDLAKHITNARHLDQESVKQLMELIEQLAQYKQEYSVQLRKQTDTLRNQLEKTSEIGTRLHANKQNLELLKARLSRNKEKISEKFQSHTNSRSHYGKQKVWAMLNEKNKTDKMLKRVVSKLARIEQNLELVNANYITISDMLTDCESELEACIEECSDFQEKLLKFTAEIFPKSNSIIPRLYVTAFGVTAFGMSGTTMGLIATGLSLMSGPFTLIPVSIATVWTVGWTAGWLLSIWRDESENSPAQKFSDIIVTFTNDLKESRSELEKVRILILKASSTRPWRVTS